MCPNLLPWLTKRDKITVKTGKWADNDWDRERESMHIHKVDVTGKIAWNNRVRILFYFHCSLSLYLFLSLSLLLSFSPHLSPHFHSVPISPLSIIVFINIYQCWSLLARIILFLWCFVFCLPGGWRLSVWILYLFTASFTLSLYCIFGLIKSHKILPQWMDQPQGRSHRLVYE